ncbi:MAG: riboflavin biosynthesis protein RibF, partial [Acidimicrobiia bacterium]
AGPTRGGASPVRILSGPWRDWEPLEAGSSLTVGVLDGVHLGHRKLVSYLDSDLIRTVLTFEPHPVEVLAPGTPPRLLTTVDERVALLARLGVIQVGLLDLAEIKSLTPEEFVEHILIGKTGMSHLVVGHDFRFGRDRSGDVTLLEKLAERHGFRLDVIDLVGDELGQISSTRIRSLLEAGHPEEAARLLGSWYRITNIVVEGERRGVDLGYPTINMRPPPRKLVPATGIYACFATVLGETHQAAVNVGVRPTFGGGELLIEAHLLDFDRSVYREEATVEFVSYLRPEMHFDRVEDLVEQMGEDVEETRRELAAAGPNVS